MSTSYYKKTIQCNCGCDYGSDCGKKISYILVYEHVSDHASVYVNHDSDNPESNYEKIYSGNDEMMGALFEVMDYTIEKTEKVNASDIQKINQYVRSKNIPIK